MNLRLILVLGGILYVMEFTSSARWISPLLKAQSGTSKDERSVNKKKPRAKNVGAADNGAAEQSKTEPSTPAANDAELITNSVGMKLAKIPAGQFVMGSPPNEKDREAGENQIRVTITKPFYMGIYEVTQAQYQQVMKTNPSFHRTDRVTFTGENLKGVNTQQFPVEEVTWNNANEFCKKLSEDPKEIKAGRKYRLPTEAEWEYACRAGTETRFHYGNEITLHDANCDIVIRGAPPGGPRVLRRTTTVGSYKPNAFGLYDMHGNVSEFCSDWYDFGATRGKAKESTDPQGPAEASNLNFKVRRGGSWMSKANEMRSACVQFYTARGPIPRVGGQSLDKADSIGFRVVCVMD